jgi:multidrug efflux pump subunit AcrA (membrane-fusion protein)
VKRQKIYILILLLIVPVLLLSGCASKKDTSTQETTQIVTIGRGNIVVDVMASGNLITSNEADLAFSASSKVTEVLVAVGDWVDKGQKLAAIDTTDLEINLAQAQANVKSAKLNLEDAKEPTTTASGTSAPDPLDIEIKEIQLESANMSLTDVQAQLANAVIYAPFSGRIAEVNVAIGDEVTSSTKAIRLIDPNLMEVNIAVSEMDVYQLNVGDKATVELNALSSVELPAKVVSISPVATIQSGVVNYAVNVQLDPISSIKEQQKASTATSSNSQGETQAPPTGGNSTTGEIPQRLQQAINEGRLTQEQADEMMKNMSQGGAAFNRQSGAQSSQTGTPALPEDFELKEGLTVTVTIVVDQRQDILRVPNSAISSKGGRTTVQIIKDGVVEQRDITTGITDYQYTEVTGGLSEGEQVVIAESSSSSTTSSSNSQQRSGGGPPGVGGIFIR